MNEYQTYIPAPSPATQATKSTGRSAIFLATTITYTLLVLFRLIMAFVPSSAVRQLAYGLSQFDLSWSEIDSMLPVVQGTVSLSAILGLIPSFLALAGFWMIYSAARKNDPMPMRSSGFTMLKVVLVLRLISIILLAVMVTIVFIPLVALMSEYSSMAAAYGGGVFTDMGRLVIYIVMAFLVFFLVLAILYYAKGISSITTARTAAGGMLPRKSISMYVIVINYILMAFCFIAVFSNLVAGAFLDMLISLSDGLFLLFLSISMTQLRSRLRTLPAPAMQGFAYQPQGYPAAPAPNFVPNQPQPQQWQAPQDFAPENAPEAQPPEDPQ